MTMVALDSERRPYLLDHSQLNVVGEVMDAALTRVRMTAHYSVLSLDSSIDVTIVQLTAAAVRFDVNMT